MFDDEMFWWEISNMDSWDDEDACEYFTQLDENEKQSVTQIHEPIKNHQKQLSLLITNRKPTETSDIYWIYAESKYDNHSVTDRSGKWLLFIKPEFIDEAWAQVKIETEAGHLGACSKVSTVKGWDGKNEYVICVYTDDWEDEEDVMAVRRELRNLGFTKPIPYKTDKDTLEGKYAKRGHKRIAKYYE